MQNCRNHTKYIYICNKKKDLQQKVKILCSHEMDEWLQMTVGKYKTNSVKAIRI